MRWVRNITIKKNHQEHLRNYQLARDRKRRQIRILARYEQTDVVSFAFNIAEQLEIVDPSSFEEVLTCNAKEK